MGLMLYIYYLSLVFKNNFENATDFFSFCYKILNKFQAYSLTGNFTSIHQFLKTCKKSLILWVSPVNSNFVSGLWAILSGQNLLSVKSLCMSLLFPTISVCLEERNREPQIQHPTRYISKTHSKQQQQLT